MAIPHDNCPTYSVCSWDFACNGYCGSPCTPRVKERPDGSLEVMPNPNAVVKLNLTLDVDKNP